MRYYPILLDLEGKKALIVGGGEIAERKTITLMNYNAKIYIVSRTLTNNLKQFIENKAVYYLGVEFEKSYLDGVFLVIAATDDNELNGLVSKLAAKRGILVNAVDQPSDCSFIVPSVLNRGDLCIAISTGGKSPALAKKIRVELESRFGPEYAHFLEVMGRLRSGIRSMNLGQKENSRIFQDLVDSKLIHALARRDRSSVSRILKSILPSDMDIDPLLRDIFAF
jgi:precorrin-2 dehydrogenase/sirohydrochlorin ferrochelatase